MNRLDLRGVRCPMNVVRLKLALEPLGDGELLEVLLDPGEGLENVPKAARGAGHTVIEEGAGPPARVVVRKGSAGTPR